MSLLKYFNIKKVFQTQRHIISFHFVTHYSYFHGKSSTIIPSFFTATAYLSITFVIFPFIFSDSSCSSPVTASLVAIVTHTQLFLSQTCVTASCLTETGEMATSLNWKKFNGKKFHHKKFSSEASNNKKFLQ